MVKKGFLTVFLAAIFSFAVFGTAQAGQIAEESADALINGYHDALGAVNYMRVVNASSTTTGGLDTWTSRSSGTTSSLNGITYGNNKFLAVGSGGTVSYSTDGSAWTTGSLSSLSSGAFHGVTYGNGKFVAVGYDATNYNATCNTEARVYTSADGITWAHTTAGNANSLDSVAYGNGIYVAVGDIYTPTSCNNNTSAGSFFSTILTSADGSTWTAQTAPQNIYLIHGVTYGNGIFVAAGNYGLILTSPDGKTWTAQNSGTTDYFQGITYGNGTFMAVGYSASGSGIIYTSADGATWTNRTPIMTSYPLYGAAYGSGTFIAVGGQMNFLTPVASSILTTSDLTNWSVRNAGTNWMLWGAALGSDIFVAVGSNGTILQSGPLTTSSCTYTISPTSKTFTSKKGRGTVTVTASSSSCTWTASESLSWVSITSGSKGTGSGTVSYSVSKNTTKAVRTGNITIAGKTFTITQKK